MELKCKIFFLPQKCRIFGIILIPLQVQFLSYLTRLPIHTPTIYKNIIITRTKQWNNNKCNCIDDCNYYNKVHTLTIADCSSPRCCLTGRSFLSVCYSFTCTQILGCASSTHFEYKILIARTALTATHGGHNNFEDSLFLLHILLEHLHHHIRYHWNFKEILQQVIHNRFTEFFSTEDFLISLSLSRFYLNLLVGGMNGEGK